MRSEKAADIAQGVLLPSELQFALEFIV